MVTAECVSTEAYQSLTIVGESYERIVEVVDEDVQTVDKNSDVDQECSSFLNAFQHK